MFNKKGFTMIELLGTIMILGILSLIGIGAVSVLINRSKEDFDSHSKKMLELAARSYFSDYRDETEVTASVLKEKNYLESDLKNSKNKSCMNSKVTKDNNKYIVDFNCNN